MCTGSGLREARSAQKAAELFAELRLAGATVHSVTDQVGRVYQLHELVADPMEVAELEYLTDQIGLLKSRLTASVNGLAPRSDDDVQNMRLELERAEAQLARVIGHYTGEH